MTSASISLGIDQATIWAILFVEAIGCGYLSDRRPQILFERHVFHRLTGGIYDSAYPDISNAQPGGYDVGGAPQYSRLGRAFALDQEAALQSASWGIGQVMGENYAASGFGAVTDMVAAMCASEDQQLSSLVNFVLSNGLQIALQNRNWSGFAYKYNGPDYAQNNYDGHLAARYAQLTGLLGLPDMTIRTAQLLLLFLGFDPHGVDGALGSHTLGALHDYQTANNSPLTSGIDSQVLNALSGALGPAPYLQLY
jgi:hypothetical protein